MLQIRCLAIVLSCLFGFPHPIDASEVSKNRKDTDSSALNITSSKPGVLLIVLAGNRSRRGVSVSGITDAVGSDLFEKALNLSDELKRQGYRDIEILQSSHDHYRKTEMVFFSFTGNQGRRETLNVNRYLSRVDEIVTQYPGHRIVVIGHSYGGWLALKVSLKLRGNPHFKYLATIDAISRRLCFISLPPPAGCTRFPQDFAASDLARVGRSVSYWDNFYQKTDHFLHSEQTPFATSNTLVRSAEHKEIDGRREVWRRIESNILRSLRR